MKTPCQIKNFLLDSKRSSYEFLLANAEKFAMLDKKIVRKEFSEMFDSFCRYSPITELRFTICGSSSLKKIYG